MLNKRKNIIVVLLICLILCVCTACSEMSSDSGSTLDNMAAGNVDSEITSQSNSGTVYNEKSQSADVSESESYDENGNQVENEDVSQQTETEPQSEKTNQTDVQLSEEKMVYNGSISVEAVDYQKVLDSVKKVIFDYQGIIESYSNSDVSDNWYYDDYYKNSATLSSVLTVRIPSAKLNAFLETFRSSVGESGGKIITDEMTAVNMTSHYHSCELELKGLKKQEVSLLAMMDKAKTIDEMITVQDRLTTVQTQIDQLQSTLNQIDTDVAYSQFMISIQEVMEYRNPDNPRKTEHFIDRLKNAFDDSIEGFCHFLEQFLFGVMYWLPYLLFFGIFFLIGRKIYIGYRKKHADDYRKRKEDIRKKHQIHKKNMKEEKPLSVIDDLAAEESMQAEAVSEGNSAILVSDEEAEGALPNGFVSEDDNADISEK